MNLVLQISLMAIEVITCGGVIALLVFELKKIFKSRKKLTKEEKIKIKQDKEKKILTDKINQLSEELSSMNKKK